MAGMSVSGKTPRHSQGRWLASGMGHGLAVAGTLLAMQNQVLSAGLPPADPCSLLAPLSPQQPDRPGKSLKMKKQIRGTGAASRAGDVRIWGPSYSSCLVWCHMHMHTQTHYTAWPWARHIASWGLSCPIYKGKYLPRGCSWARWALEIPAGSVPYPWSFQG